MDNYLNYSAQQKKEINLQINKYINIFKKNRAMYTNKSSSNEYEHFFHILISIQQLFSNRNFIFVGTKCQ